VINKKYFLFLFFGTLYLFPLKALAYRWPFDDGNGPAGPHRITAAFGEFRSVSSGFPEGRLHAGQDMNPSNTSSGTDAIGLTVYAIEGGIAHPFKTSTTDVNERLQVGRFVYVHVVSLVDEVDSVNANDPIATIKNISASETPHLHLAEFQDSSSTIQLDPIRPEGLDNYIDNLSPSVFSPNFYHDSQGDQFVAAANGSVIVWGKVDIRARAVDSSPNSSGQIGLYQMGFGVQNPDGTFALPVTYRIVMSQLQMPNQGALEYDNSNEAGDRGVIYDPTDSNNSTFFYWVTSRLNSQDDNNQDGVARNGFWNTKQKINQDESIDAIINFESKFPDDKYIVWSVGKDIEGNGGDLENRVGADSQSVTIDNFMPYVQSVSILQGLNVFYGAEWPVTAQ